MQGAKRIRNMVNGTYKRLRRRNAGRRNKPVRIERSRNKANPMLKVIGDRFATAILSGNKREIDRILRDIARTSPPLESPGDFLELMSELLSRTAHQALKMHVLQEQLRNLALTDDLTGLHNRRGFFALAGQQIKYARRNHDRALLFFADINGLKQINDRFGHAAGSGAIKRIARVLERTFRDSDIIARLGGDEFAVLANEAAPDSEKDIWRRLQESLDAEAALDRRYALSISVGAARFDPRSPATLEELLNSADRAMYAAKRGRAKEAGPASLLRKVSSAPALVADPTAA